MPESELSPYIKMPDSARYATFQQEKTNESDCFTVKEAIECIGLGRFQIFLALVVGVVWVADSMEIMVISILGPVLICEWNISVFQEAPLTVVVFLGFALGSPLAGWIGDKYGRRLTLAFLTIWIAFYGSISALSPNLPWLYTLRFLMGVGVGGVPLAMTYFVEFLPNKLRGRWIMLMDVFFGLGGVITALFAILFLLPYGWRWWVFACAMPSLLFTILCFVFGNWLGWLPRSPRFDIITNDSDNALKTLQMAARWNRTSLPKGQLVPEPTVPRGRIQDLFSPALRLTTCLLAASWFFTAFCYFGLILFTTQMIAVGNACDPRAFGASTNETCVPLTKGDYTNIMLTSSAELIGILITAFTVDIIGCKATIAISSLVYGIICIILCICMPTNIMIALLFIARAAIGAVLQAFYIQASQVYPTEVRALGTGFVVMFNRLGAVVTPYIATVLIKKSLYYGLGVYAGAGFILCILVILIPKVKNI